jgi:hypothetical protein
MLMLEAYLPSAITVEELTRMMDDFIQTGVCRVLYSELERSARIVWPAYPNACIA